MNEMSPHLNEHSSAMAAHSVGGTFNMADETSTSEERYRAFMQQSSEGIWRFELEQPVSVQLPAEDQIDRFYEFAYLAECNDAMARMYGLESASQLSGARLGDFLIRSDPTNIEYLRAFIASGYRLIDAESHEVDRYGNPRYFLNSLIGLIEGGSISRAWGTQRDITGRKQAEEALRESEERLRMIWDFAGDAMALSGPDGIVLTANPAYCRLYGYSADEVVGHSFAIIFSPEMRGWAVEQYQETFAGSSESEQAPNSFETTIQRKDGSTRLVESSYTFVTRGDERVAMLSIIRDITDRKAAEDALKQSERTMATLLSNLPGFVFRCRNDEEWTMEYLSDGVLELSGYSPNDFLTGKITWDQLIHPDDVERVRREAAGHAARREPIRTTYRIVTADERIRWVWDHSTPIFSEGSGSAQPDSSEVASGPLGLPDDLFHWEGFVTDVTERVEAEQEREKLLAREQAAHAEAEAAVQIRDTFISLASHELKTPITTIKGFAQLLDRELHRIDEVAGNERVNRSLGFIVSQANRLTSLIDAMLDVSRIETGQLALAMEPIDMGKLVEEVVAQAQVLGDTHPIEVSLHARSDAAEPGTDDTGTAHASTVIGDRERLRQVLVNLLENAIKYSPKGALIKVVVARVEEPQPPSRIAVSVRDEGIGIPTGQLGQIFNRFYRAPNASTQHYAGLGLGLYITREIIQRHGGRIWAESNVGEGSTFHFTLPASTG